MDTTTTIFSVVIALLIAGFLAYLFWVQRKENERENSTTSTENKSLQLQAYERLILLTDRISLPNLISRLNHPELSAREMQMLLTQNIKQEFDYNITQQIYVSTDAWNAVKNLKEQNLLTINEFANSLPLTAKAFDLNKALLNYLNTAINLNESVSALLSFEAKKIL
jgi:hypothetical protein